MAELRSTMFTAAVTLSVISLTLACSPTNWRPYSMEEYLYKADIVIYGQEVARYRVNESSAAGDYRMDGNFSVFCVLKTDNKGPVPQHLTMHMLEPVTSCDGSHGRYTQRDVFVAALRRSTQQPGAFTWHEVSVTPNSPVYALNSTQGDVLGRALRVCGLQHPAPPQGRAAAALPRCPAPHTGACVKEGPVSAARDVTLFVGVVLLAAVTSLTHSLL